VPVSILQSLAIAENANALHLRDFGSLAIFEFFNTFGAKRSSNAQCYLRRRSGLQLKGDLFGVIGLIVAYKS
jgi:hypothetical protein